MDGAGLELLVLLDAACIASKRAFLAAWATDTSAPALFFVSGVVSGMVSPIFVGVADRELLALPLYIKCFNCSPR